MIALQPNKALSPFQRVLRGAVSGRIENLPGRPMLGADATKEVSSWGDPDVLHDDPIDTTRNAAPGHNASLKQITA